MLHKIQHARSGGVLHGTRPRWLSTMGWDVMHDVLGMSEA